MSSSQQLYSSMIDRAIGFATQAHASQRRKMGDMPYIAHPVGVAMILQRMGCREEVVSAALLHDTVEDTDVSLEDIRRRFGEEVAEIVAGCTELPRREANWESRKLHMIERLRTASLDVKLVVAADKYHNLSHILKTKEALGPVVWERFGRGKEQQAWYYRTVLGSILENVPDEADYPIFGELEGVVEVLFAGIRSAPPGKRAANFTK
jgi:(p)ppGpp synthase/HD superfamily hydrolase